MKYGILIAIICLLCAIIFKDCHHAEAISADLQKLEISRRDLLKADAGKDSLLAKLQAEVKRNPKAKTVTVFKTITTGKASGKTVVIDSCKFTGIARNKDFEATIEADHDSIRILKYKLFNEFVATDQGITEKEGTEVQEVKTWQEPPKKQHTGLKILVGFILGALTIHYL